MFHVALICCTFTLFYCSESVPNMFNENTNVNIVPFLCLTFEHNADSAAYKFPFVSYFAETEIFEK